MLRTPWPCAQGAADVARGSACPRLLPSSRGDSRPRLLSCTSCCWLVQQDLVPPWPQIRAGQSAVSTCLPSTPECPGPWSRAELWEAGALASQSGGDSSMSQGSGCQGADSVLASRHAGTRGH